MVAIMLLIFLIRSQEISTKRACVTDFFIMRSIESSIRSLTFILFTIHIPVENYAAPIGH
jgi:hypothetical protein